MLLFAVFVGVRVLGAGLTNVAADATPTSSPGAPSTTEGSSTPASGTPSAGPVVSMLPGSPTPAAPPVPTAPSMSTPPPTPAGTSTPLPSGPGSPGSPSPSPTTPSASPSPTAPSASPSPVGSPTKPSLAPASSRRALPAVRVLGALKLPLSAADYDDDPVTSSDFVVGPSTQLGATQQASAVFAIPTDATEPTAEVYSAVRATSEAGPILFHRVSPAVELLSGAPCETALAPAGTGPSIAAGLVESGQLASSDALNLVTDCRHGRASALTVTFPVPRELPPGKYFLCAGAVTPDGYGAAPACRSFEVVAVSALATDIAADGIGLGDLRSGVASAAEGDFAVGNAAATIVNAGNVAPVIAVRIQPFTLEEPAATPVIVRGSYTVALRAPPREGRPASLESQAVFLADAALTTRSFSTVCLAPGETAALDFGVTPQGALAAGSYGGALRVAAAGVAACPARTMPDSMLVSVAKGPFAASWAPTRWTWSRDADGDGHGGRSLVAYGPAAPEGYVASSDDCDDTRDRVHPGAPELPDGLDNDCDGSVDVVAKAAAVPTAVAPAPVAAPTPAPSPAPTSTPAATPTATPTADAGSTASPTPTPGAPPSATPTITPGAPPTGTPTPSPTVAPAVTPTAAPSPSPTPEAGPAGPPTATPSPTPPP